MSTKSSKDIMVLLTFFHIFILISVTTAEVINLTKCCEDGKVYDTYSGVCQDWVVDDLEKMGRSYPIDPAVLNLDYDSLDDDYHNQISSGNFTITSDGLPNCSYGTESTFLVNPENDHEFGSFFIDPDVGVVIDSQAAREYHNFCVDRGFRIRGANFKWMGTVAVVCQEKPEIACQYRPCIRACCKPPLVYDIRLRICREPYGNDERIIFKPNLRLKDDMTKSIDPTELGALFLQGFPQCSLGAHLYNLTSDQDGDLIILDTGELQIKSGLYNYENYCIKHVEEVIDPEVGSLRYFPQAVVCAQEDVYGQGYLWWVNVIDFKVHNSLYLRNTFPSLPGRHWNSKFGIRHSI